jgi:crossover junction endodeoxyribonuclease RusA
MPDPISFDVEGIPAPQGSKTRMPNGAVIEGASATGRAKHRAWRTAVSQAARTAAGRHGRIDGPTVLVAYFRVPRPKSRPKSHHGWHVVMPDKDKVLRATLDGLADGGLIRNDAQVCEIHVYAAEVDEWTGAKLYLADRTGVAA